MARFIIIPLGELCTWPFHLLIICSFSGHMEPASPQEGGQAYDHTAGGSAQQAEHGHFLCSYFFSSILTRIIKTLRADPG